MIDNRIPVAVFGATGAVGQRMLQLLDGHPWFRVAALGASDRSAGKPYAAAARWIVSADIPAWAAQQRVIECSAAALHAAAPEVKLVFSALPSDVATEVEGDLRNAGYGVISNAKNHRMDADVPLVIPEVNPDHLQAIRKQQENHNGGFIVTNGNCSTIAMVLALAPLHRQWGLRRVIVTTMQAASGAGYPGQPALDLIDNVVPYIGGEEDKLETEPLKMLGGYDGNSFIPAGIRLSATCNRVPVRDGHLCSVSIELEQPATIDEIATALSSFRSLPQELGLPSAPERPIIVRPEQDRPQPQLDRDAGRGMASVVGRIRPCPVLDYKFLILGHNTVRGAAGGVILVAEMLTATGLMGVEQKQAALAQP